MIKIMFVCFGNICRSPMAEFVMRDMVEKAGLTDKIHIASSATSTCEIGNSVHRGTREKLAEKGISTAGKVSMKFEKPHYDMYDYIIGMDSMNIRDILKITGGDKDGKISKLLSFAGEEGDIADPWYTHNFDVTYDDVVRGCTGLLNKLKTEI